MSSLVLASTSVYRRQLLGRLGLAFEVFAPEIDETPLSHEHAEATARRLACAKAQAAVSAFPAALIIGSDQVAEVNGVRLDKPGSHDCAVAQLSSVSGRSAYFHTAIALLNARTGQMRDSLISTRVQFRSLNLAQIEAYLRREQPYDCAGSAKSEGLGIALIEEILGPDPTALIGLPLMTLVRLLEAEGVAVL